MPRGFRFILFGLSIIFAATSASRGQETTVKWSERDLVMPKSDKIELRFGNDTVAQLTDIRWPAAVQKVKGHWLLIGDDGTFRVDGKIIRGWVSNKDVVEFVSATSPGDLVRGTTETAIGEYTAQLASSPNSATLQWLRAICLEQTGEYGAAIEDYCRALKLAGGTDCTHRGCETCVPLLGVVCTTPKLEAVAPKSNADSPPAPIDMQPADASTPQVTELKLIAADSLAGLGRCIYAKWVTGALLSSCNRCGQPQEVCCAQHFLREAISEFKKANADFLKTITCPCVSPGCTYPGAPPSYYFHQGDALCNVVDESFYDSRAALHLANDALKVSPFYVEALVLRARIYGSKVKLVSSTECKCKTKDEENPGSGCKDSRKLAFASFNAAIAASPADSLPNFALAHFINRLHPEEPDAAAKSSKEPQSSDKPKPCDQPKDVSTAYERQLAVACAKKAASATRFLNYRELLELATAEHWNGNNRDAVVYQTLVVELAEPGDSAAQERALFRYIQEANISPPVVLLASYENYKKAMEEEAAAIAKTQSDLHAATVTAENEQKRLNQRKEEEKKLALLRKQGKISEMDLETSREAWSRASNERPSIDTLQAKVTDLQNQLEAERKKFASLPSVKGNVARWARTVRFGQ